MLRVIVGAGAVVRDGWLSLQHADLDITDARQWARLFAPGSLDAILCEHVLEHLSVDEARAAVDNFRRYLRRGGYVRCAVPDGYHASPQYLSWVAPGGPGERLLNSFRVDEPPHKVLWNWRTLSALFVPAGFAVILCEWFDDAGRFHKGEWSAEHGYIRRRAGAAWSGVLSLVVGAPYTSLIVDAVKL